MVVPPKQSQNTPKWSFLVGKTIGYHHFSKPPYIPWFSFSLRNLVFQTKFIIQGNKTHLSIRAVFLLSHILQVDLLSRYLGIDSWVTPRNLTVRPWKMMVGRQVSFLGLPIFRGYVKFPGCISSWLVFRWIPRYLQLQLNLNLLVSSAWL